MSLAEKLVNVSDNNITIAGNEQKVYDAGYSKAEDDIWKCIQNRGVRSTYEYGFQHWTGAEYIRPLYKVVPISSSRNISLFYNCIRLKKIESKYFDFSAYQPVNGGNSTGNNYCIFRGCTALEEVEDVGIQAGGYYQTYNGCPSLKTIAVMRCKAEGEYANVFSNCSALENITIEGEIGRSITFQYSPLLTIDSLKSIITALVDYSGTDNEYTYTLTLNSGCLATLEADGTTAEYNDESCTWVQLIDNKKWNLVT